MTDGTISFIFFDGRFWISLIERTEDGKLSIARHVFGAEPANPELLHFYLETLEGLAFLDAPPGYRPPKAERLLETGKAPSSLDRYKRLISDQAEEAKSVRRRKLRIEGEEAFKLRRERNRKKHRGH